MPMKASARSNPPHGYKAVIVYPDRVGRDVQRTEVVGPIRRRARKNFPTRDEAITYAQRVIDRRLDDRARRRAEYEERQRRYAQQRAATASNGG